MSGNPPASGDPDRKEDVIVWNATVARIAPARGGAGAEGPGDADEACPEPPPAEGSATPPQTTR
jgi:hypothetical protein